MTRKYFLTTILLLSATTVFAEFTPSIWKYEKQVNIPETLSEGAYVKVSVDHELAEGAQDALGDIRVIANGNEEVPYQITVMNTEVREEYFPSTLRDLSTKDGATMFILDLGQSGLVHDHLSITTSSKNFKHKVSVSATDTALPVSDSRWRTLTTSGYMYNFSDSTSGFTAGSGEVNYPPSTARYLRVTIEEGEGSVVIVNTARVHKLVARQAQEEQLTLQTSVTQNTEHKTTEILLDLGSSGILSHRITLETQDTKNFSRQAIVTASDDGVSWQALGNGYVFGLVTPLFSGTQLSIPYQETRMRYVRVLIMNQDDAPVSWGDTATVDATVRAVVFAPTRGKTYAVLYGNQQSIAPRYDLARYFAYVESGTLETATLSPQKANPLYVAPVVKIPQIDPYAKKRQIALNMILVISAVVLGFFLFSYTKKMKGEVPPSEEDAV